MKRNQKNGRLVALGTASTDTLGTQVPAKPEGIGYFALGLSDR